MEKMSEAGMGRTGFKAHCPHCRCDRMFVHARIANWLHLLLTIVTAGLWAIVWLAVFIGKSLRPWRCAACGWHKPEFRKITPDPGPPEAKMG
jgi:hypothetical protein